MKMSRSREAGGMEEGSLLLVVVVVGVVVVEAGGMMMGRLGGGGRRRKHESESEYIRGTHGLSWKNSLASVLTRRRWQQRRSTF
jgi:hypothetical protein